MPWRCYNMENWVFARNCGASDYSSITIQCSMNSTSDIFIEDRSVLDCRHEFEFILSTTV